MARGISGSSINISEAAWQRNENKWPW